MLDYFKALCYQCKYLTPLLTLLRNKAILIYFSLKMHCTTYQLKVFYLKLLKFIFKSSTF